MQRAGRRVLRGDDEAVGYAPLVYSDAGGQATVPGDWQVPGFPGQSRTLADLYYNRHRDYDPTTGRYLQADPIGLDGGANVYAYAGGNPVNAVDPMGLEGVGWWNSGPQMREAGERDGRALRNMFGALRDFYRNYNDMRDANTIGADKYFHCKANCEASKRGATGCSMACTISNLREITDQRIKGDRRSASLADQVANRHGRNNSGQGSCSNVCSRFRPHGLQSGY